MNEDHEAPNRINVARRALILSAVVCRASLEGHSDKEYREETADAIHDWLNELDLWPYVEPLEEQVLRSAFGAVPNELAIAATWYSEGLAILAWAIKRGDFPSPDQKVDPFAVTNSLCFLDPCAAELLSAPVLREMSELEAAREWFYDVHCTLKGNLNHRGEGRLAGWIGDFVSKLGLNPGAVMRDCYLAVDGEPIHSVDRRRVQEWESVVRERHRAAIWLAGEDHSTRSCQSTREVARSGRGSIQRHA